MIRGESKVTSAHLERTAIVYVRQSTLVQVREHTESTLRQYDLAAQAARLGWAGSDIEVIDADLGLSGRTASHRDGFKHLVARVCLWPGVEDADVWALGMPMAGSHNAPPVGAAGCCGR